jgi:hypothetical protein
MDLERTVNFEECLRETVHRVGQLESCYERLEESTRQMLVLVHGLRDQVYWIAEALAGVNEGLMRHQEKTTVELGKVKIWAEPRYNYLDARLRILENRAEWQREGVMAALRKMVAQQRQ